MNVSFQRVKYSHLTLFPHFTALIKWLISCHHLLLCLTGQHACSHSQQSKACFSVPPPKPSKRMLNNIHAGQSTAITTFRMRLAHVAFQSSVARHWCCLITSVGMNDTILRACTVSRHWPVNKLFLSYLPHCGVQTVDKITDGMPKHVDGQLNLVLQTLFN